MRLFAAINLNDDIKNALISVQEQMKQRNIRGNYTKPANLHLTLAFIGEYGDPDNVIEALEQVRFRPFEMKPEGIGSFGSLWWAGLSAPEELSLCASRTRRCLADAGIPFDRKKFLPHITLIREPNEIKIPPIAVPDAVMTVNRISLMRSDRGKGGMIYTEIGTVEM